MRLPSSARSGSSRTQAETEADEATVDDTPDRQVMDRQATGAEATDREAGGTALPRFTPSAGASEDDVPGPAAEDYEDDERLIDPADEGTARTGMAEPSGTPAGFDPDEPVMDPDAPTPATGTRAVTAQPTVPAPRSAGADQQEDRQEAALAGTDADLDAPLLSEDPELQARWQRVQAGFVDDPRVAVTDAANLVDEAGNALAEALRERQRRLRAAWDTGRPDGSTGRVSDSGEADALTAAGTADTERLRLMMRRYRTLFNQLSRS